MHQLIDSLVQWYSSALDWEDTGLWRILMAIESSVFPLPSEVVDSAGGLHRDCDGQVQHASGSSYEVTGIMSTRRAVMYWESRLGGETSSFVTASTC